MPFSENFRSRVSTRYAEELVSRSARGLLVRPGLVAGDDGRVQGNAIGSLALLGVALLTSVWVLLDARGRQRAGDDVVARIGPVELATPEVWFVATLLLWVVVVPLYLVARRS